MSIVLLLTLADQSYQLIYVNVANLSYNVAHLMMTSYDFLNMLKAI